MKHVELIPSIVPFDAEKTVRLLLAIHGFSDRVHIDIDDGKFTPRETIDASEIPKQVLSNLKTEVHVMAQDPEPFVATWLPRRPDRMILHAESKPHAFLIQQIQHEGAEVVLALAAGSSLSLLAPYLHLVDSFLFLCISPPGDQGRPFLPEVLLKIKSFHKAHPAATIECDGGMSASTIQHAIDAGATRIVVGSALFGSDKSPSEQYTLLRQIMLDNTRHS